MSSLARRDPSTRTVGADNVTMLLWATIQLVPGITRDELLSRIASRINDGHAKRRYHAHLVKERHRRTRNSGATPAAPEFADVDTGKAKRYLVTETLRIMCRWRSVERDDKGGYRVLRRPRTDAYQENDDVIDVTGEITRHHMLKADAIRTLKGARQRFETAQRACLSDVERRALATLLDALQRDTKEETCPAATRPG